ncbi:MAG TPA: hypothetical protein VJU86_09300 [Pyrinomonadaceae bacterium]|nr:hypothetical protein [Pyrinomonadaceae bacterium]
MFLNRSRLFCGLALVILLVGGFPSILGQKKSTPPKSKAKPTKPVDELAKLREEFVTATKDYKVSLENLKAVYEKNVIKAEARLVQSNALFAQGLIAKNQLDAEHRAVAEAKDKVAEVNQRISNADTQIAQALVEADAEKKMAKRRIPKGATVQTASYVRFNGGGSWALGEAWKVQRFFQDAFKKPLPITVFGQGAIHDRWRLDHRNSIDVSLHPDGPEGQSLINFLRMNGIPFLAFRGAIPGTATGPHIHIGRPSHRY